MKNESTLINKRRERFNKLKCWWFDQKEFYKMASDAWSNVLKEDKDSRNLDIKNRVRIYFKPSKDTKYLEGQNHIFGEFLGQPFTDTVIILYMEDICEVNLFQKDLIKDHIYFILKHELAHWFGMKHEDLLPQKVNGFGYLLEGKK